MSFPLLRLLILIPGFHIPLCAAEYWVAPNGNNTNPGTAAAPFATVTHALTHAVKPGDTVNVATGIYRNEKAVFTASGAPGKPITLQAAPGAKPVLKGSEVVTGWTRDDPAKKKRPIYRAAWTRYFGKWDGRFTSDPQNLERDPDANLRARNQLFVDGAYVEEVPRLIDLRADTFYIDRAAARLYLWLKDGSAPAGKLVEVSNTEDALIATRGQDHLVIRGFQLEHCANKGSLNAMLRVDAAPGNPSSDWSDDVLVEKITARFAAGTAIGAWRSNPVVIRDCEFTDNGQSALLVAGCKNSLVSGGRWLRNNHLAGKFYNHGNEAVSKVASCEDTVVENIESAYNRGFGLWVDGPSNRRITLRNNRVHDNGVPGANTEGIRIEIAYLVDIYNNVVYRNDVGISLDTSSGCRVFNNTVVYNASMGIYSSGVRAQWAEKFGPGKTQRSYANRLFNNLVAFNQQAHNRRGYVLAYDIPDPSFNPPDFPDTNGVVPFAQNHSDYNLFYSQVAGGGNFFVNANGDKTGSFVSPDLKSWQTATAALRWDVNSLWNQEPRFVNATKDDYRLRADSPGAKSGTLPPAGLPPEAFADALGAPRRAGQVAIGAYQPAR